MALAEKRGVRPAQLALAWLLHQAGVAAPILGATRPAQLDDAVAALDLDLAERVSLEEPYRPRPSPG